MSISDNKTGYILSTAGAVPIKNEKGELSMRKVKVTRYVAGKRPDYAEDNESGEGSDNEVEVKEERADAISVAEINEEVEPETKDPRWTRLQQFKQQATDSAYSEERISRHRQIHEPEVLARRRKEENEEEDEGRALSPVSGDEPDEDDVSDDELERRRRMLRERQQIRQREDELLSRQQDEDVEDEEEESEEESDEDEYTDSDDDQTLPRLKPVFVRKRDRVTLQETEKEQQRLRDLELEQKRKMDERKKISVKMVENLVKLELDMERKQQEEEKIDLDSVCTDDENEELAYEAWKIRELKRLKRDKEERDSYIKEKAEWDRVHSMSEEERRAYLRANPRIVTNKQAKGKYKFLQKYFHRGVFFLDQEDEVLKRNFAEATLEDHFDKTILPKVMQVKDFGKAGRTKWTHLVAEDTTDFDSAWVSESALNLKFFNKHAAGVKDHFERPGAKKKKKV